ncbi:MAG TPA: CBS domain-containing protein [Kofleriaceae bacterium]|nr:CBS domain-containing protein [Kofleriaceae bacterium]
MSVRTSAPHAWVGGDATKAKVVAEMKAKDRGAVLVEEDGALVGIFTERELLNASITATRNVRRSPA